MCQQMLPNQLLSNICLFSHSSQVTQRRQKKVDANTSRSSVEVGDGNGQKRQSDFCYKCNIKVDLEDITTYAVCRGCDQTVCRSKLCSDWDRTTGYWECLACINNRDGQVRAGEWILDQLNRRFKRSAENNNSNGGGAATQDDTVASHRDVETRESGVTPLIDWITLFYIGAIFAYFQSRSRAFPSLHIPYRSNKKQRCGSFLKK